MELILMNTTIVTGLDDGAEYVVRKATAEQVAALMSAHSWTSYLGHDAAAEAFSAVTGHQVPVNRAQAEQAPGQLAVCMKLRGRAPEGAILDRPQMEAIGYDFFLIARVDGDGHALREWLPAPVATLRWVPTYNDYSEPSHTLKLMDGARCLDSVRDIGPSGDEAAAAVACMTHRAEALGYRV